MLEHAFGKVLLCIMAMGLGAVLFFLGSRRKGKKRSSDLENYLHGLLRRDERLAQVVAHLSYLHDLSGGTRLKGPLARKKMKLILEMRMRIRKHRPNSSSDDVSHLCRQLLITSRTVSDKRQGKQ